jgi:hypothetical protein
MDVVQAAIEMLRVVERRVDGEYESEYRPGKRERRRKSGAWSEHESSVKRQRVIEKSVRALRREKMRSIPKASTFAKHASRVRRHLNIR